ncbi:thiol reductant ABC exporter subunit CydD [Salisediminibacterium beveridgei]|uniref:Transport ATP-binding protein CydD n=1 Tax=Salisediminibacterium beveridgei TaxID=632773 RepID=A0A1D7QYP2_9BACI|nr:thiol reductant ABC exporter subunit CydD [Salisediminibacterium beveridgei]AOM84123.1 Transport ATP-binding protein CydD [Salisediminibacterium beveridgei]
MMKKELNREAFVYPRRMFLLVLFTVLSGAVIIGQAYLIASLVDAVFLQEQALRDQWILMALLLGVFFARVVFSDLPFRIGIRTARDVKDRYRQKLLERMTAAEQRTDLTGKRISLYLDVVDELDSYFSSYFPQLIQTMVVPVMILITVFTQNIYSGLIMLITAPLIPVFMMLIGSQSEKKAGVQMAKLQSFSGHFLDTLKGVMSLKLLGQTSAQREVIREKSLAFREATMDVLKIAFLSALMLEILATIATAMIAVEVGLRLVFGHLTFQTAFFVLLMAPELYLPLKNLGASFHSGRNSIAAGEKLKDALEQPLPEVTWGREKLALQAPPALTLDNLNYYYPGNTNASLEGISATIPAGEHAAIIGVSGAGKSTLMNVMAGLTEAEEVDSYLVNGQRRCDWTEESWFQEIGYVSQHPYLFAGTVRSNLLMGKTGISGQVLNEAVRSAGLSDLLAELPDGLDAPVGEGGQGFSGGEKQRIALARVMIQKPKLLFFDEPTSGLDVITEKRMNETIAKLSEQSTVVTIAHRLRTIRQADRILVIDQGILAAEGTFDTLAAESQPFKRITGEVREGDE